jgi:hypothetical protein
MADTKKVRGTQLIRADRSVPGVVTFYDTRVAEAAAARIGVVRFEDRCDAEVPADVVRAALHGWTQAILDSSNSLTGDARVAFVRAACDTIRQGGWPSAPIDEEAAYTRAHDAIMKLPAGDMRDQMVAMLKKQHSR